MSACRKGHNILYENKAFHSFDLWCIFVVVRNRRRIVFRYWCECNSRWNELTAVCSPLNRCARKCVSLCVCARNIAFNWRKSSSWRVHSIWIIIRNWPFTFLITNNRTIAFNANSICWFWILPYMRFWKLSLVLKQYFLPVFWGSGICDMVFESIFWIIQFLIST